MNDKFEINHFDYLYARKAGLDHKVIKESALKLYDFINKKFVDDHHGGQETMVTGLYGRYNLMMYAHEGFHELFEKIQEAFYDVTDSKEKHYMQCWLNVYQKGQFIDWHVHWPKGHNVWHGFYCANVEPDSYTSYRIPIDGKTQMVDIDSENDLLVIGKSDDDKHKSSEWHQDDPRITIAFDIVPRKSIVLDKWINHWIPI